MKSQKTDEEIINMDFLNPEEYSRVMADLQQKASRSVKDYWDYDKFKAHFYNNFYAEDPAKLTIPRLGELKSDAIRFRGLLDNGEPGSEKIVAYIADVQRDIDEMIKLRPKTPPAKKSTLTLAEWLGVEAAGYITAYLKREGIIDKNGVSVKGNGITAQMLPAHIREACEVLGRKYNEKTVYQICCEEYVYTYSVASLKRSGTGTDGLVKRDFSEELKDLPKINEK